MSARSSSTAVRTIDRADSTGVTEGNTTPSKAPDAQRDRPSMTWLISCAARTKPKGDTGLESAGHCVASKTTV